jgi:hypothetical protein
MPIDTAALRPEIRCLPERALLRKPIAGASEQSDHAGINIFIDAPPSGLSSIIFNHPPIAGSTREPNEVVLTFRIFRVSYASARHEWRACLAAIPPTDIEWRLTKPTEKLLASCHCC